MKEIEMNKKEAIERIQKSKVNGVLDESIKIWLVKCIDKDKVGSDYVYRNIKYDGEVINPSDIVYGRIYMVTYMSPGAEEWLTNYTDYLLTLDSKDTPLLLLLGDEDYDNRTEPMEFYSSQGTRLGKKFYEDIKSMGCIERYEMGFRGTIMSKVNNERNEKKEKQIDFLFTYSTVEHCEQISSFTMLVSASDIDDAKGKCEKEIYRVWEGSDIFDDVIQIYLMSMLQINSFPNEAAIAVHESRDDYGVISSNTSLVDGVSLVAFHEVSNDYANVVNIDGTMYVEPLVESYTT